MDAPVAETVAVPPLADAALLPTILVAIDQLPYPPRNGITLPVYNYLLGLQGQYRLQLLLFVDGQAQPSAPALAENEARFGSIIQVPLRRRGKWRRLLDELRGVEMYQHGYQLDAASLPALPVAQRLLVSPASAVAKWRSSGLAASVAARVRIAAVNDCTAAEYYFRGSQNFGSWKARLKGVLDRLRTPLVARVEAALLGYYQHVLLQTETDQHLLARLVSPALASRVSLAPNGVRPEFFSLTPSATSRRIVFVAELSGEYASIAQWLVSEVWPAVRRGAPDCTLLLVGKGASPSLQQAIAQDASIAHQTFVPDLLDVYGDAMIVLSPVFKGFGLINKTLEAMAAGVPVVGGAAAFNGIPGHQAGVTGITASPETTEFSAAIVALAAQPVLRQHISAAGRTVLAQHFSWDRTVSTLRTLAAGEPMH